MEITVKLYGMLRRNRPESASGAPHHPFPFSLPEDSSIADLVRLLEIKDGMVNGSAVNGEATNLDTRLQDGDTVSLFPPAAGGQ